MQAGGGGTRDRRHSESVRRGTLSQSASSSRNTDAVAPELPRPCADDEPTDDGAGVTNVVSGTTRSTYDAGGGGGSGTADVLLVLVLDDGECFFSVHSSSETHNNVITITLCLKETKRTNIETV